MKLSIFNLLIILLWGCAHQKKEISSISSPVETEVKTAQPLISGPLGQSDIFVDKTNEYGLSNVVGVHLYAVDFNADGYTDLVVQEDFYSSFKFYVFNPLLNKFILGESPFLTAIRGAYLNFVDLNHDGVLDVIVGSTNQKSDMVKMPPKLFKATFENRKLQYQEMPPITTELYPTTNILALDYNLDGELDLFFANWFAYDHQSTKAVPDLLYQGLGFNFSNQSHLLKGEYDYSKLENMYPHAAPTLGASVCDVDKNGFPDILTSNSNGYYSKLWLNFDGLAFNNYGEESRYAADEDGSSQVKGGGNSFFSLCGDYNNDGLVDVVVGNMAFANDLETKDRSSVLTGARNFFPPQFIRTEFETDTKSLKGHEAHRRGVWIDYNLDGLNDFIVENSGYPPDTRLILYQQMPDHSFLEKANQLGVDLMNPSGVVTLDLNRDGVMDFISGQSKTRGHTIKNQIFVFINQTKRANKGSVRFHLQGKYSNFFGISSSVWFSTKKTTRYFNVEYNSGSLPSQNEEGAYFAFDQETPQAVVVNWSYSHLDRLNRQVPLVKKYDLSKLKLKGGHHEFNLCEDGRILKSNCF